MTGSDFLKWDGWSFISICVAIAILFFSLRLPQRRNDLKEELKDPHDREQQLVELARRRGFRTYRARIRSLSQRLNRWFGGKPLGGSAFARCLLLAYTYPFLSFLVAWVLGGDGSLAGVELFSTSDSAWVRTFQAIVLLVACLSSALIVANTDKISRWINDNVRSTLNRVLDESKSHITRDIGDFAVVGSVAVAVAVGGVVAVGGADAFVVGTLLLLLPIANALMDWLSWAMTRSLLPYMTRNPGGIRGLVILLIELLADLGVAIMCLSGLAVLLPTVIEGANLVAGWFGIQPIDWWRFVQLAGEDPLGGGLFVWGMLFTTLVPTIIHVFVGFIALFSIFNPLDKVRILLPDKGDDWVGKRTLNQTANLLVAYELRWIPATVLSIAFVVGGTFFILYVSHFFRFLANLALCSTAWSHGQCTWF